MTTHLTPICVFDFGLTQDQKDKCVRKAISALPDGCTPVKIHWPDYFTICTGEMIYNFNKNKFVIEYAKVL